MPEKPLPSMNDVAAHAGCARATVSMALRNDPRITAATRARVVAAARQLGYRANPLVAALMTTRRMQRVTARHTGLAFVTTHPPTDPWRHYPTYVGFHAGARERATELGYTLEEFPLRAPGMTPRRLAQIIRARNIHGLLIAPLPHEENTLDLDCAGVAVVGLGLSIIAPSLERVSNDHFQSALLAIRHCRELGYRRVGFAVSRETSERLGDRWLSGYLLATRTLPAEDRLAPLMPHRQGEIAALLPAWCRRERPEVVLFGNYAPARPYRLPRGIGTVSLDVERLDGPISGIFQDDRRIGAIAVDHLVGRMQRGEFGPDDRARLHLLAGQWARGATAPGPTARVRRPAASGR